MYQFLLQKKHQVHKSFIVTFTDSVLCKHAELFQRGWARITFSFVPRPLAYYTTVKLNLNSNFQFYEFMFMLVLKD